jgi:MFS transporter, DHA2 family, multidrug resistance protein
MFVFDPPYIKRREGASIDYWGIGFLAIGIGTLQILLDKGQEEDWFSSDFIRTLMFFAVAGLLLFVIRELMTDHPVVDLRVFRIRTYTTGVFIMTVLGFVLYGSIVLLPIWLQELMGYSSLDAGMAMLPRGLGSFLFMPVVGILMGKVEARKLLGVGIIVAGYSLWMLGALNLSAGYWDIFLPQLIQGLSMGLLFVPLTTITNDPIPKAEMGNATSIFNLMRNLGASFGIATVTTIVARHTQTHANVLAGHITPYNVSTQQMMSAATANFIAKGADPITAARMAYAAVFGMVQRNATMMAFIDVFRLLGILFIVTLPLLFFMKSPKHRGGGMAH